MYNIGLFEKVISFTAHKAALSLVASATMLGVAGQISNDPDPVTKTDAYSVSFKKFSPAYAAFEDEHLFDEKAKHVVLASGVSNHSFKLAQKEEKTPITLKAKKVVQASGMAFDGSASIVRPKVEKAPARQVAVKAKVVNTQAQAEEFGFGPLVALANPQKAKPVAHSASAAPKQKPAAAKKPEPTVDQNSDNNDDGIQPEYWNVTGGLALKDGLAFLGEMEVSWVVGDYELAMGSINTVDASYDIQVSQLIGDIIVSLYDNNDELIGEGILDLTQFEGKKDGISADIELRPIDWDYAGKVVSVAKLGMPKPELVEDVSIDLYAFNESTKSDDRGAFRFYNWKKTNSRTLAIASKPGYWDSIFMLDSKSSADVILFTDSYMENFFSYIKDQGFYDVDDMGVVYGQIGGAQEANGYHVTLEKSEAIYFETGLATRSRRTTSGNGLFAFVGLQDGDYTLNVEKDGEIIDQKIVVVEQGKVSPVKIDLKRVRKHLEFYDPMNPEAKVKRVSLAFFDGVENIELDAYDRAKQELVRSAEPALVDYASQSEVTRTFVSRSKGVQRLPLLQDSALTDLAAINNMSIAEGLIIGFIESDIPYFVDMKEGNVSKIIYFNENAEQINIEESDEIPYGFIMSGFPQGLSSIQVFSRKEPMILMTDFVYSDHQAISVINSEVVGL